MQEYAKLGPQQREHLNMMNFLKPLVATIEHSDERTRIQEINGLFEIVSLLARRSVVLIKNR